MPFSLYDAEEKVISDGEGLVAALSTLENSGGEVGSVMAQAEALLQAYRKSYREQKRLVSVSDRLQEQLNSLGRQLQESTRLLEAVLENMSDGIAAFDAGGRVSLCNSRTIDLLHFPPSHKPVGIDRDQMDRDIAERARTVLPPTGVRPEEIEFPDGRIVQVRKRAMTGGGEVAVYLDVTAERRRQRQLLEARRQAETASRAKSLFLAGMSHEIRTPMTGVIGMTDLLLRSDVSDQQRQYLTTLKSSARALLTIINDILDFSKIEAGRLVLEESPFQIRGVIEEVVELLTSLAQEKDLALTSVVEDSIPPVMIGDSHRLRQVLFNLVGNAIKFTERGLVVVRLKSIDHLADRWRLRFEIQDTGVGISQESQDRLFNPFTQGDASTTRRFGGTGLGLAICRNLIGLMGGTIGLRSAEGVGSLFWFEIPMEATTEPDRSTALSTRPGAQSLRAGHTIPELLDRQGFKRPQDGSGSPAQSGQLSALAGRCRILVAEDTPASQMLIRHELEGHGYQVDVCDNGQAVLDAAAANAPHCILMDIQMPVMDGIEATEKIRALPGTLGSVPIIGLTADLDPGETARYDRVGFNLVLSKPIDWSLLHTTIQRLTTPEPANTTADAAPDGTSASGSADAAQGGRDSGPQAPPTPEPSSAQDPVANSQLRSDTAAQDQPSLSIVAEEPQEATPAATATATATDGGTIEPIHKAWIDVDQRIKPIIQVALVDMRVVERIRSSATTETFDGMLSAFAAGLLEQTGRARYALEHDDVDAFLRVIHGVKGVAANFGAARLSAMARLLQQISGDGGRPTFTHMDAMDGILRDTLSVLMGDEAPLSPGNGADTAELGIAPLSQVLILDDTLANTMLMRSYLSSVPDVSTVGFTSPVEALQWCRTGMPDLVLADLVMPELDGFDFLRRFRGLPGGSDIPVLIVTAVEAEDAKRRALTEGANDFLRKPVDEAEFVARVRNMLKLRQRQSELEQANEVLEEHARDLMALNATLEKEIESRRRLEDELRRLASFDSLTGLLMRRRFLELANREINRMRRIGGRSTVLMVDVDHFKSINDQFGHSAGDDVLRWFADRCREALRTVDLIGRFGGEEFVALLPDTHLEDGKNAAERLRKLIESTPVPGLPTDYVVTVSIGVDDVEPDADSVEPTIGRADKALYNAKNSGRNRVELAAKDLSL